MIQFIERFIKLFIKLCYTVYKTIILKRFSMNENMLLKKTSKFIISNIEVSSDNSDEEDSDDPDKEDSDE